MRNVLFMYKTDSKHQSLFASRVQSKRSESQASQTEVAGSLQPININNSAGFFRPYLLLCFFAAEHRLHQPVQQLCSRSASVLARCWALLVAREGGLLSCISRHKGMWGKLPRAEWANHISHRRLWGLDKNYYCYPQVACSQVLSIVSHRCHWYPWVSYLFFDVTGGKKVPRCK